MIFLNSIIPAIILWLLVVLAYFFRNRAWKFSKFKFSVWGYYLILAPLVVGMLVTAERERSAKSIVLFIVFAVAGVIGEALTDLCWQTFFQKGLWVYNVETVYHRFTSWLNLLPWGIGGLMYLNIAERTVGNTTFPSIPALSLEILLAFILFQICLFKLLIPNSKFKFKSLAFISLVLVYLPIVGVIVFLVLAYGPIILALAFWFAVIATVAEYLFGKTCSYLISKKLWTYTYGAVDNGHFTLLAIPLFCIGGFYFWIISLAILPYLK